MNKLLCISLAGIFIIFLVLGIVLNTQQGLYFEESSFWRRMGNGRYQHGRDWILPLNDGTFELFLNGKNISAVQSTLPDGGIRMEYSDGWTVERSNTDDFLYEFGSFAWSSDASLILTDMEAAGLRFAAAAEELRHPIYDADGENIIGETVEILSSEGNLLDYREIWFKNNDSSISERQTILLQDGTALQEHQGLYDSVMQNAEGEYLLDSHSLGRLPINGNSLNRGSFTWFLLRAGEGAAESRGEWTVVFLYILLYCLGAAQMLWPQKLAFLGSRWQYREEPHLSDAGITAMFFISAFVMLISILLLFAPL